MHENYSKRSILHIPFSCVPKSGPKTPCIQSTQLDTKQKSLFQGMSSHPESIPQSIGVLPFSYWSTLRNDLAVLEEWGNPLTEAYEITVPKGTKVLKGIAAPQEERNNLGKLIESKPGGGVQYYLNYIPTSWLN